MLLRPRLMLRRWADGAYSATAVLGRITLPLIMISVVVSTLGHTSFPALPPEARPEPVPFMLYSALTQLVLVVGLAAAGHYLCDLFQGRSDFNRALAAVTLAGVPAWLGNVLAVLPWPWGAHLALGLILYSVLLLYTAFASVLGVARGHRLAHLFCTLAAGALITFAFAWQAVSLIPGAAPAVRLGTTWLI